ncbi:flagellar export chaperone FliS [Thalassospira xiamenensis]|nr:flagellar export chaperone FliS [Thalassospira xiamenensis]
MNKGLNAYKQVGIKDQIATADPHRIIQMLMQGAIDRMAQARGAMERKDYAEKSAHISKSLAIVTALKSSLKPVDGAQELTDNMTALYDFVIEQLTAASATNQPKLLVDAAAIIQTLKEGWDEIPMEAREVAFQQQSQPEQQASNY